MNRISAIPSFFFFFQAEDGIRDPPRRRQARDSLPDHALGWDLGRARDRPREPQRRARGALPAGAARGRGRVSAFARATAPFARRLLRVTGVDPLGAYQLLRAADEDGPEPAPGQFLMLA